MSTAKLEAIHTAPKRQLNFQGFHMPVVNTVGGCKLIMEGIFTPQKLANAAEQDLYF